MKKLVGIIGHFGYGKNLVNGQTIKTKIIADELSRFYGNGSVITIDTAKGIKGIVSLFFETRRLMKQCKNIIILPSYKGIVFFSFVLYFWRLFYKTKLHYVVIGGWLIEYMAKRPYLSFFLKKLDVIFTETTIMAEELKKRGFPKVIYLPNCKRITISNKKIQCMNKPYRLCIFSRISQMKGIDDAIKVVKEINTKADSIIYLLDIYGPVEGSFNEEFFHSVKKNEKYVVYNGIVKYGEASRILSKYDFLLFPTKYFGEGIPGTIIDAYAAGTPVIFAKWEHWQDILIDGKTGIGYEFGKVDQLKNVLWDLKIDFEAYKKMSNRCILEAKKYHSEFVLKKLINELNN